MGRAGQYRRAAGDLVRATSTASRWTSPTTTQCFLALREELSLPDATTACSATCRIYVDLLCAQVYADYICEQGGAFLRTEFASEQDPAVYTRRMLGLDGIDPDTGRTRVKRADGGAFVLSKITALN